MKKIVTIICVVCGFVWEGATIGAMLVLGMGFLPVAVALPCTISIVKYVHTHGFTDLHAQVIFASAYPNTGPKDIWFGFGTYVCCVIVCLWALVWVVKSFLGIVGICDGEEFDDLDSDSFI